MYKCVFRLEICFAGEECHMRVMTCIYINVCELRLGTCQVAACFSNIIQPSNEHGVTN